MGNTSTCFEKDSWSHHPGEGVKAPYPETEVVDQDMAQPLPHYFISSGHNSYLTGDQLFASSGTATIVKSLRAGCRVIELDVYNGSQSDGPICKHGGTFTAAVSFQDCIEAINREAFHASAYPVIITMENHTDKENQGKMAKTMVRVLGDRLFVPDPSDSRRVFMSPEALKNKIVCRASIKDSVEYHPEYKKLIYIRNTKCSSLSEMIQREHVVSSSFEESAMMQPDELGPDDSAKRGEWQEQQSAQRRDSRKRTPGADGLGDEPDDAVLPRDGKVAVDSLQELYTYTSRHLMRVYPSMWRVTSSNYNPMRAWVRGASLAALNWQKWDEPLWCNQAKFNDNGRCGYILKPQWMRTPGAELPVREPRTLVVRLYCAHMHQGMNFCIFKDDLFVKMTIWGMPCDCASQKTHTVQDTGRLVVEKDYYFSVHYPEMAVLCFTLNDDDAGGLVEAVRDAVADTLGYFTLSLATLKEGDFKIVLKDPGTGRTLDDRKNWIKVNLKWMKEKAEGGNDKMPAAAMNPIYVGDHA